MVVDGLVAHKIILSSPGNSHCQSQYQSQSKELDKEVRRTRSCPPRLGEGDHDHQDDDVMIMMMMIGSRVITHVPSQPEPAEQ